MPPPSHRTRSAAPRAALPAFLVLLQAALLPACATQDPPTPEGVRTTESALTPVLTPQASGVGVLIQAVSPVDRRVVWASGHGGTWLRTLDGGATWRSGTVRGADTLQFRDVHAFDAGTAVLLSAGDGGLSRVYRTEDGGRSWELRWTNPEPEGFYDCLDFWDARRGALYGDAVDGSLRVLVTDDGGRSWERLPPAALPDAQEGEGGFAASGTCLRAGTGGVGWIGTGAAPVARVLRTEDRGLRWHAHEVPVVAGDFAGLTTLAALDEERVLALGGDLGQPDDTTSTNVARSDDGGRTWSPLGRTALPGAVYGVDWGAAGRAARRAGGSPDDSAPTGSVVVAVGPAGADWSADGGRSWSPLVRDTSYWAVALAPAAAGAGPVGWLVGPEGRIARVDFRRAPPGSGSRSGAERADARPINAVERPLGNRFVRRTR